MLTYDPNKRLKNLKDHGIDFAELDCVFEFPMLTYEDVTQDYGEQRLRSIGLLQGRVIVMIWVAEESSARIISCRHGDKREMREYFKRTVL